MKIRVNENLTSLFNYIREYDGIVTWFDLIQYSLDYKLYQELYVNNMIIDRLINEHNSDYLAGKWVKPV